MRLPGFLFCPRANPFIPKKAISFILCADEVLCPCPATSSRICRIISSALSLKNAYFTRLPLLLMKTKQTLKWILFIPTSRSAAMLYSFLQAKPFCPFEDKQLCPVTCLLFELNRRRRLPRTVIHYPIHALHFIYNPVRHLP